MTTEEILMDLPVYEVIRSRSLAEGRAQGIAEGRVEGRAEGQVEGRAEGLAQGQLQGRLEGLRTMLRGQLEAGFGPLPDWAMQCIDSADETMLTRWGQQLLSAKSLEDALR